jgi:putative nucleotidyltransferase with HDIG domain
LATRLRASGATGALVVAAVFFLVVSAILMLREEVLPYRPGQYVAQDIVSRVDFSYHDRELLTRARQQARDREFHVYKANGDGWTELEAKLRDLPDRVSDKSVEQVPETLRKQFALSTSDVHTELDSGALTALEQFRSEQRRKDYNDSVKAFVQALRPLAILNDDDRREEIRRQEELFITPARVDVDGVGVVEVSKTYSNKPTDLLLAELTKAAATNFREELQLKIVAFTVNNLAPTHVFDAAGTTERQNLAAAKVPREKGEVRFRANQPLKIKAGPITEKEWQILRAEHDAFLDALPRSTWILSKVGTVGLVAMVTVALSAYVFRYQSRVVRNHARAMAIAGLLIAMLLPAQLAGIGSGPLYLFGTAPTVLVAMILAIAYDRRFALGVSTVHAILVTAALDQGMGFFLILFCGILTSCFLLDDVRTRSKLIEVGGATALVMMLATAAALSMSLNPIEPPSVIFLNALHAGGAGLAVGFIVLGILPFIEKAFRITTSMTLLELADMSHPLLRRLHAEAPGTYNHSLQVSNLSEAAAEAIGANSLLCRVGSYYHDVGKINKAEYFIENQSDGVNRHINLTPSVSLLIIIGHVKDGIELAREYLLPTSLFPFIQQHHGTTLVEYFYHEACKKRGQAQSDGPQVPEEQFRYPGPKPRMKEVAIVMLADAVESATRALGEWSPGRIEDLVRELAMKRLLDGQFSDCDLTMRDLETVQRAMVKALLGIYHGRIPYPSQNKPPAGFPILSQRANERTA